MKIIPKNKVHQIQVYNTGVNVSEYYLPLHLLSEIHAMSCFLARQCTISMQIHSNKTNRRTNSQSTQIHSRCCWNLIVLLFPTLLTFLNLFVWILFIFLIQQSSITIHWKTSKTKKSQVSWYFAPFFQNLLLLLHKKHNLATFFHNRTINVWIGIRQFDLEEKVNTGWSL